MEETRKFEVLKEGIVPAVEGAEVLPVGSIVMDVVLGDKVDELLADGSIVEVAEEKSADDAEDEPASEDEPAADEPAAPGEEEEVQAEEPAAPAGPVLTHAGKTVISSTTREHNGAEVHVVTLEGGETLDLTDEEYEAMMARAAE